MSWGGFGHPFNAPPQGPPGAPPPPPPPDHTAGSFPFWEAMRFFDPRTNAAGQGVDHTGGPGSGFPNGFAFGPAGFEGWAGPRGFAGRWGGRGGFGDWGHGHRGRGGRHAGHGHGHRHRGPPFEDEPSADEEMRDAAAASAAEQGEKSGFDNEKDDSPATLRDGDGEHPDPPEEVPGTRNDRRWGRRGFGHRGRHGHGHGFRGFYNHPYFNPQGAAGSPPAYNPAEAQSFAAMMNGFANHPFVQNIRQYAENMRNQATTARGETAGENDYDLAGDENFTPPVDIFDTANNWTIHVALPGAKKEDIAVNWDADKSSLVLSGVVYRQGDEAFQAGMVSGERKVGLFERSIKLPPPGRDEKEEADGSGITAKLEDGILVVIVPKVEKEWTEVRKVDIL